MPESFDESRVPFPVRAELRSLPQELARQVMGHLVAASDALDDDPQLALRHAQAARRRAARLPVVREAMAEVAYAAEDYPSALTEYRALHRMTGADDYLPVIADCERAVGKQDQALRTIAAAKQAKLSASQRIELVMVEAGLRGDLGQRGEAARLLREAISARIGPREEQARVRYAYAALLESDGDISGAQKWFTAAASYDDEGELDTDERIQALGTDGRPDGSEDLSDRPGADEQADEFVDLGFVQSELVVPEPAGASKIDDPQAGDVKEDL